MLHEREECYVKIIHITSHTLEKYRRVMLSFVKRYAKNENSYKWLFHIKRQHLQTGRTKIILALWDGKIIALLALSNNGNDRAILLLSPQYQYHTVAAKLLELANIQFEFNDDDLNIRNA